MVHPEVRLSPLHELRWFWMLNLAASIWEQEKEGLSIGIASPHGAGGLAELQEQNQGGERQGSGVGTPAWMRGVRVPHTMPSSPHACTNPETSCPAISTWP